MFRWPGRLPASRVQTQLGSLVDVAPTLLSLAGMPVPSSMQGQDLSPVLGGQEETLPCNTVFIEAHKQSAIGLRTPTAMYGLPLSEGTEYGSRPCPDEELYFDLQHDPYQLRGESGAEYQDVIEPLRRELLQRHRNTPWLEQLTEIMP